MSRSHLFLHKWLLHFFFISFLISSCIAWKIWWPLENDFFPMVPITPWLQIPVWVDHTVCSLFFLTLTATVLLPGNNRMPTVMVLSFLVLLSFHVARIQPWSVFMVASAVMLRANGKWLHWGLVLLVAGIYLWSGIFKFNYWYRAGLVPLFAEGVEKLFPFISAKAGWLLRVLHFIPVLHVLVLPLFFIRVLRKPLAIVMMVYHAGAIAVMAVWTPDSNYVIWPWNISLLIFWVWVILSPSLQFQHPFKQIKMAVRHAPALFFLIWVYVLPVAWLSGKISSTPCFHLYSVMGNEVLLTPAEPYFNEPLVSRQQSAYYSIGLAYLKQYGVPFPDAPANFMYTIDAWKKKGLPVEKIRLEKYTWEDSEVVIIE
jgi:hypothetical protein